MQIEATQGMEPFQVPKAFHRGTRLSRLGLSDRPSEVQASYARLKAMALSSSSIVPPFEPQVSQTAIPEWRRQLSRSPQGDRWQRRFRNSPIFDLATDNFARVGETISGRLTAEDEQNNRRPGAFADDYLLVGDRDGQVVQLQLDSSEFDTYLQILDAETGEKIAFNDDKVYPYYNLNSQVDLTIEAGKYYIVRVTSYAPRETGAYTLTTSGSRVLEDGYHFAYGHGLVDAAAAVARAVGQRDPFASVRDLGGRNWNLDMVNAPEVWAQGYTGAGIVVAVLDTGVDYNHRDLRENIWQNIDEIPDNNIDDDGNGFVDDSRGWKFVDRDSNDVRDNHSHGTHVAGTIAAERNEFGMTGVAPDAQIMPVEVVGGRDDRSLRRFDANVAKGIRYAVDNGADIISMSIGNYPDDPSMRKTRSALRYARNAGVVAVMASGNERDSYRATEPIEPAFYARQNLGIAVGAVNRNDRLAGWSTPAGTRDSTFVVAPGVNVYSTLPYQWYGHYSGTSMATPHVAGVVALMLSANPRLSPDRVEQILIRTARDRQLEIPLWY